MQQGQPVVERAHPGPVTYVKIAVILAIVTIIEVATYYLESFFGAALVPILLVLSAAKFVLVVGFYMHLKFDAPLLRGMFAWGMTVAIGITLAMLALYKL
ncbi:cytochrome C oxidase subunit IV family protein [Thermomicrobiaceae bacterium CFH 74404]|uniref:Cytochrome C oxidase subunit IV family protein n=2 Tax=Thermomicrobia TaxID=189775 RepID=A0AA41WBW6_9BACT|nr:cytochrome C oxidase subunit IV family protein [Thermalbibacter longus]MCM8747549.1 cytochrome C oxidase subunit IV family protein [Thermalbibacter longus]